jgi:hypothetical protein
MKKILLYAAMTLPLYAPMYAADETVAVSSAAAPVPVPEAAPAATPPAAQIKAEAPVNGPKLWVDTPYFKGYVPGVQVSVISLFDFVNKRPLVGVETSVFAIKRVQVTAGGVTSIQGKGSPYIGGHLLIPNPTPSFVFLNDLELGGWGGRDFNEGRYMAGLKIGKQIW